MLYLRCLQAFSDNLQSCHFPVYHSINSYIFLSKFSNFLVITSLENRLFKNLIIRLFLILFSIILSYYASFAILFISSFASINPRCVYTFNVTPISECPIKYWSAFGFIPAFFGYVFGACALCVAASSDVHRDVFGGAWYSLHGVLGRDFLHGAGARMAGDRFLDFHDDRAASHGAYAV